jgi:UDP-N-acetylmuramate dehydrogenase
MQVGGSARHHVAAHEDSDVVSALAWANERGLGTRVLGGGSNVVVGDEDLDGLVLALRTRGVSRQVLESGDVLVTAAAGEPWDDFVALTVADGLQGLECLSGIPGLVGATPIQNVGAYGQDVAETIQRVRVLDRRTLLEREFDARECGFGYRDSFFKSVEPDRYVVLAVSYRLTPGGAPAVRYAELEKELARRGVVSPTLSEVRETVIALRRLKSMVLDPSDPNARSCGSFFVNPVVAAQLAELVCSRVAPLPVPQWPQPDGRVKLAAGWLIEQSGFAKGTRRGAVGLSSRHALAIVCQDGASAGDVLRFAEEIRAGVHERFGVLLEPEPVFWGQDAPLKSA